MSLAGPMIRENPRLPGKPEALPGSKWSGSAVMTAKSPLADKKMPVMDICRSLNASRPGLYRWIAVKPAIASPGGRTIR